MRTLVDLLCEPDSWADRDALVSAIVAELGVAHEVADTIAANLAHCRQVDGRRRLLAETGDEVVQGLTAAVYALELDDRPRVESHLRRTLHTASRLLTDLAAGSLAAAGSDRALLRSTPADLRRR